MEKLLQLTSFGFHLCFIAAALIFYVSVWFVIAATKERADLADIAWGLGFVFVSWVSYAIGNHQMLGFSVNILVTVWGCRLSYHIYMRNKHREEDFRYKDLKKNWNSRWDLFVKVFLLQGGILYIVALPIFWIHNHEGYSIYSPFLLVWLGGFILESISDAQLSAFKKNPENRGHLLTTGMWAISRHPNYLGEMIQWWAIWALSGEIFLFISPLLISYLIIKVSGISPLEKKMRDHPDFIEYEKKTPALVPTTFVNGAIFILTCFGVIYSGTRSSILLPLLFSIASFGAQFYLFAKRNIKSFVVAFPIAIYATIIGLIQELILIHFQVLEYANSSVFPPFWVLCLYPLLALTLNSSIFFLNRNLLLTFLVGGGGALVFYLAGDSLEGVHLLMPYYLPLSWGITLSLLILLNRKLMAIRDEYMNPTNQIIIFFDTKCPICSREMESLKKRKKTGEVKYSCLVSDEELIKFTKEFSYKQAMQQIHAISSDGKVFKGIDALAALYARTDLLVLAILLKAPGFTIFFQIIYVIWARFRPKLT